MKWQRFFLLLFLIPSLGYTAFYGPEYREVVDKITFEWNRHIGLVDQFNKLSLGEKEQKIDLLREAILCCRRGISHCDHILSEIAEKSKDDQKLWRDHKNRAQEDKSRLNTAISTVQRLIDHTFALAKAVPLHQESQKKAEIADLKSRNCARRLNNIDEVVSILSEAGKLYEEALSLANEAFNLLSPYPDEENKNVLRESIERYQAAAHKYKQEAADWPVTVAAKKAALKERFEDLKKDSKLFEEKGLKFGSYETQKQAVSVLEELIESSLENEVFKEELAKLKHSITAFEIEAENNRLKETSSLPPKEDFIDRENERRQAFFKSDLILNPGLFLESVLYPKSCPYAFPLDGSVVRKDDNFSLFADQFYRFLIQSDTPVSELFVKVYKQGELVHEEAIALPLKNTSSWDRYVVVDGLLFIPETKLKNEFGLDLRLNFFCDPRSNFSMVISQKCSLLDYQFVFSLKDRNALYTCNFLLPPPWQLECLRKPTLRRGDRSIEKCPLVLNLKNEKVVHLEKSYPILDQFVDQLKKDPLALAAYVHNEIEFDDRLFYQDQEKGIFYPLGIQRNACMTFLEKRGTPWEQCQLLVYLLRQAGYQALYLKETVCTLPKAFLEKLLFTQLPKEQTEGLISCPWVVFFDGKEWISLFPWMKELQVHEGYDLYSLMPEEYASADRWILRYLKEDERILKHIHSDKDDTLGSLFIRFVEEELRKQQLSLSDVGTHSIQIKKQFSSWKDFPRPLFNGTTEIYEFLDKNLDIFAKIKITISSHENPQKEISHIFCYADLNCNAIPFRFTSYGHNKDRLHINLIGEKEERVLDLDESDQSIDIEIYYENFAKYFLSHSTRNFSLRKGTEATLCFHVGGEGDKVTSQFYQQFSSEKDESKRLHALLAFVGAAYFEKCSRTEKILAQLHKTPRITDFACGLSKFSPSTSVTGGEVLKAPQIDMTWCFSPPSSPSYLMPHQKEIYSALRSFVSLFMVDSSSNEHQVLKEVFGTEEAVSTVKLLQLANREQQKKGLPEPGFLSLTSPRITAAENIPEDAQHLYFPQFKDLNFSNIKSASCDQWKAAKERLGQGTNFDPYAYAYMTPGLILSQNGFYKEVGTLIFHLLDQAALISNNNLVLHGGLGSPLPSHYFAPSAISNWQLIPNNNTNIFSYTLNVSYTPPIPLPAKTLKQKPDIRPEHKSFFNMVGDPVDVVTGAFYIDEVDLALPGPFPLEIRRNYSSQNPLDGELGVGWKLSLNPHLVKQDDKLYAAEADGTVIVYNYNPETSRWEVFPEDNPDLFNFNKQGIGSTANPFRAYIQNDILYGADGSKRIFEKGLLREWINNRGNSLSFLYNEEKLSRIESSNGDFCGIHYNHEGRISEIYAKDGRRISYNYNSQGDLIKVLLPNSAPILYDYDHSHRIIRETKPHGKVLENLYEDGKVTKQRSPMGLGQAIITTATFDYQEGLTTVTDGKGGKTTYKIFQKQIYKIIDPLGYETFQAWFVDEASWFDPLTEKIVPWDGPGGSARSLKSSTDKRGLTTYYLYDKRGNPTEMGLQGKDLTGSGKSHIHKKFTYNDQDLCIQEEVLERKTLTLYDTTFPYLPKRIETYSGNHLLSYIDLEYNPSGLIEKEDLSGALTLWTYDSRGFPTQKTQTTGTDDPDVITLYAYNHQGQCIYLKSADTLQENDYDIMGNLIESKTSSPSGIPLSATYIGYDLNNQPIWKQTANRDNTLYLDYHASGLVKASRQTLTPSGAIAYTLYEYDALGSLIEEVDPRGYTTYRDYDPLGKVIRETKEGLSTSFTYESGGLLATLTTPSGATTTRLYTTNGLLKEEHYPDGTQSSIIYDLLGRPIQETKNNITWDITYDDPHYRVTRTNIATHTSEVREFDARGNLIRFTDAAGYTSEKTYDHLNRPKTEKTPSGQLTTWKYHHEITSCLLPSGEQRVQRFEAGRVAESAVSDPHGNPIATSLYSYDPEHDVQCISQGEESTTTEMNTLGLPIKVQKGEILTTYEYDFCGNCILITDADRRTTHQTFDGLGRLIQKELPDGSLIHYVYDLDSNITEYHLPNGTLWAASYDSMGRKIAEELQAQEHSSLHWDYVYESGYLKEAIDPMQRIHSYFYDTNGRLSQETVNDWHRYYTYDPRGFILTAEQIGAQSISWWSSWFYSPHPEHSKVERSYDADGRLTSENIYLNSTLIQQTHQTWDSSSRTLHINDHTRTLTYQNNRLAHVSTPDIHLSYTYTLSGSLNQKLTPFSTTTLQHNTSGLPTHIDTALPTNTYQETLSWNPSGKLAAYASPLAQEQFTYTDRGHLQSTASENYTFDFGTPGTGVRTSSPHHTVPPNGLDPFGKIVTEIIDNVSLTTTYNPMGEVTSQNSRHFEWDPWGRLLRISDETLSWEASYDAFGRRLQTRHTTPQSPTLITNSFYDPEEEFQEIGVQHHNKIFWKLYGPTSCDAVLDNTGASAVLLHNALDHLTAVTSRQGTLYCDPTSPYGPQISSTPSDLLSYAQSLSWHSKSADPTGLIWLGARYYDPKGGRFLSPDPISHPLCLDLYTYASGDPINYLDPDGRFDSPVYQLTGPSLIMNSHDLIKIPNTPVQKINFSSNESNNSLNEKKTSTSATKIPLTFYGNFPGTQTPGGKSTVGHGWIGGVDANNVKFTQGAWPGGRIRTNENKISLCNNSVSLTVWVTPEQQKLAIKAGNYEHWSIYDNCIDHVAKSLDAIGYPHPHFKPSPIGISDPQIFCEWILEEKKRIDSRFLPDMTNSSEELGLAP